VEPLTLRSRSLFRTVFVGFFTIAALRNERMGKRYCSVVVVSPHSSCAIKGNRGRGSNRLR
jgi:hypothetical protein